MLIIWAWDVFMERLPWRDTMRIEMDFELTGQGRNNDWGLALLYLTDTEIAERGLVRNDFNGGVFMGLFSGWFELPKIEEYPPSLPGEKLVAVYGGVLSSICCRGRWPHHEACGA